jgi:hypothetical protein
MKSDWSMIVDHEGAFLSERAGFTTLNLVPQSLENTGPFGLKELKPG